MDEDGGAEAKADGMEDEGDRIRSNGDQIGDGGAQIGDDGNQIDDTAAQIAGVEEVPRDSTLLVTLREGVDEVEAVLTALEDDTVVAFRNYCRHWTDVKLDRGSGAAIRDDQLVCRKHGATFEKADGTCDFGPCEGSTLETVEVTVEDGTVYLTDDDYEFVDRGGTETDVGDLSSGSRIGFDGV